MTDTTNVEDARRPGAAPARGEFRDLRLTLSREEFGLVNWAQRSGPAFAQKLRPGRRGMAAFARRALFEAVRRVIEETAARGGKIPPGVAGDYREWQERLKVEG